MGTTVSLSSEESQGIKKRGFDSDRSHISWKCKKVHAQGASILRQVIWVISENKMPIGLNGFRRAILCNEPHPHVYLAFWGDIGIGTGISDVHVETSGNKCAYAAWFYSTGPLVINIMYALPGQSRKGLIGAWHPLNIQKRIRVVGI